MKITVKTPDSRADFLLELLRNLSFVELWGLAAKAERRYAALARDRRGHREEQFPPFSPGSFEQPPNIIPLARIVAE